MCEIFASLTKMHSPSMIVHVHVLLIALGGVVNGQSGMATARELFSLPLSLFPLPSSLSPSLPLPSSLSPSSISQERDITPDQ